MSDQTVKCLLAGTIVQLLRNFFLECDNLMRRSQEPILSVFTISVLPTVSNVVSFALTRAHDDVYLVPELALPAVSLYSFQRFLCIPIL